MDQFACGLVGTRCTTTPPPVNPIDARFIPGGSSSGAAVAVAAGLCSFALATDTAGSGRVPAMCCGVVGVKPTPGLVSTAGKEGCVLMMVMMVRVVRMVMVMVILMVGRVLMAMVLVVMTRMVKRTVATVMS